METCKDSEQEPLLVRVLTNLIGSAIIIGGSLAILWVIYLKNHWSDPGLAAGYAGIAFAAAFLFIFLGGIVILELCEWAISSAYTRTKSKHSTPQQ